MTEILKMNMEDARTKLNQLSELKSKLVMENSQVCLNNSDYSVFVWYFLFLT